MEIINRFTAKVKTHNFSVVLPEGDDERTIQAARKIKDEGIAKPVILGKPEQINLASEKANVALDGIKCINPRQSDKLDTYVKKYINVRKDISAEVARRLVIKPLFYAGMMVSCGDSDAVVGGAAHATASVIQAGVLTVGLKPGIKTISSCFLMVIPDFLGQKNKPFIYADCAVNIEPSADELADIALASAESARSLLCEEPRVAFLSFSTKGSASGPSVDKVKKAIEITHRRKPDLAVDGEFQVDSAIVPKVAARKVKCESAVAGKANVLIFSNLEAANIAYKLTQYMANAQAIGPLLQGFAKPIADLSRGATADDIVSTTVLTLAQLL